MEKKQIYLLAGILVAGILLGLLLSGWLGSLWGILLALVGIGGGATIAEANRMHRQELQSTLESRDKAEQEKEALLQEERAAKEREASSREEREAARLANKTEEDARLQEEGKRLSPGELLERAEREAREELER